MAAVTKYIEAQHEGGPSDASLEAPTSAHQDLMVRESRQCVPFQAPCVKMDFPKFDGHDALH